MNKALVLVSVSLLALMAGLASCEQVERGDWLQAGFFGFVALALPVIGVRAVRTVGR